jgi:hypothetical protein
MCVFNRVRKAAYAGEEKMKRDESVRKGLLALVGLLVAACCLAAVEGDSFVPNIFNPSESQFQTQTHFLVFTGTDTAGENATTATAYYNSIDPSQSKRTFPQWLVNAGFIGDVSQWHPFGQQLIACNLPGCDLPAGTYGDNIINTDSHAIVLNAADLGFVRNQFIRCKPGCTAPNPIIYTYLENYPVNPFANSANGGSGFPIKTGYPTQAEGTAAIQSALSRPVGTLPGCTSADTALGCGIQRIADVAFEWAPPPTNPSSSTRYGQEYAFIFNVDSNNSVTETIAFPGPGGQAPNLATRALQPFSTGDPFPPNLDFLGNKQHPGVCLICHGGNPKNLTSTGAYPGQGKIDGFRFLPLDVRNLLFTSDLGSESTSRINQESQLKAYNQSVLLTANQKPQKDAQGVLRPPHIAEVIKGWYTDPNGPAFGRTTQHDFIPNGWLEPIHGGTASPGSENLYMNVVGPSCRTCHFNRELSLDFGTVSNFDSYKSDVLQYTLLPLCQSNNPPKGKRPMPLAHLTYQRFWEANANPQTLPSGQPSLVLNNTAEQLAMHFGYASTASYCASPH